MNKDATKQVDHISIHYVETPVKTTNIDYRLDPLLKDRIQSFLKNKSNIGKRWLV